MCTVLRFRRDPPPLDDIRMLVTMMVDDLQLLALDDPAAFDAAATLVTVRADAVRASLGSPLCGAPPFGPPPARSLKRSVRLLAAHDPPTLRALAIEIANRAQAIRVDLVSHVSAALRLCCHLALIFSGLLA